MRRSSRSDRRRVGAPARPRARRARAFGHRPWRSSCVSARSPPVARGRAALGRQPRAGGRATRRPAPAPGQPTYRVHGLFRGRVFRAPDARAEAPPRRSPAPRPRPPPGPDRSSGSSQNAWATCAYRNRSGRRSVASVSSRNVPYARSSSAAHRVLRAPCETAAAYASRSSRSVAVSGGYQRLIDTSAGLCSRLVAHKRQVPANAGRSLPPSCESLRWRPLRLLIPCRRSQARSGLRNRGQPRLHLSPRGSPVDSRTARRPPPGRVPPRIERPARRRPAA